MTLQPIRGILVLRLDGVACGRFDRAGKGSPLWRGSRSAASALGVDPEALERVGMKEITRMILARKAERTGRPERKPAFELEPGAP